MDTHRSTQEHPQRRKSSLAIKSRVIAALLRLIKATWKINIVNIEQFNRIYESQTPIVLYFWHGTYVPILPLMAPYKGCVISSQSERGKLISQICDRFGFSSLLIPNKPTHGSMNRLLQDVKGYPLVGTAADGPLGPAHVVKAGIVSIASAMRGAAIPLSVVSRHKFVFSTRWDSLEIPLPFSRVTLVVGTPLLVPDIKNRRQCEKWRQILTRELERARTLARDITHRKMSYQPR